MIPLHQDDAVVGERLLRPLRPSTGAISVRDHGRPSVLGVPVRASKMFENIGAVRQLQRGTWRRDRHTRRPPDEAPDVLGVPLGRSAGRPQTDPHVKKVLPLARRLRVPITAVPLAVPDRRPPHAPSQEGVVPVLDLH